MASRRDEKDARRDERMQGAEGKMRQATQNLVATARNAGHPPNRIRHDLIRGVKDVLGLGTFESSSVVFDGRTQALLDYTSTYQRVCDHEKVDLFDQRARERWLAVVQDELERALRRAP